MNPQRKENCVLEVEAVGVDLVAEAHEEEGQNTVRDPSLVNIEGPLTDILEVAATNTDRMGNTMGEFMPWVPPVGDMALEADMEIVTHLRIDMETDTLPEIGMDQDMDHHDMGHPDMDHATDITLATGRLLVK